ncbi:MAG TPA: hypothetical protein VLA71_13570, partial [Algoriphagus sp.]|nr:hypothetical protein [Algoriphagus sp.]
YTDFREWEKEMQEARDKKQDVRVEKQDAKIEKQEARAEKQESAPKVKASYKQKQEFKTVTETMAKLEAEKSKLSDEISAGTADVNQLMTKSNRLQAIDKELEELELTWLELSELDGID